MEKSRNIVSEKNGVKLLLPINILGFVGNLSVAVEKR